MSETAAASVLSFSSAWIDASLEARDNSFKIFHISDILASISSFRAAILSAFSAFAAELSLNLVFTASLNSETAFIIEDASEPPFSSSSENSFFSRFSSTSAIISCSSESWSNIILKFSAASSVCSAFEAKSFLYSSQYGMSSIAIAPKTIRQQKNATPNPISSAYLMLGRAIANTVMNISASAT